MKSEFNSPDDIEKRFYEMDSYLKKLTDSDPLVAIEKARGMTSDEILNQELLDSLVSGTLIDAGIQARDCSAVNEGTSILERLTSASPERGDFQYCLANGLSAQADLHKSPYPQWYLDTASTRRKVRWYYQAAGSKESTPRDIRGQSYTNLGNSLLRSYRFVEAYDCYNTALEHDPTNGIAMTGAAHILIRMATLGTGDSQILLSVASKYLKRANEDPERIRTLAGEQAFAKLSKLLNADLPLVNLPDLSSASDYQLFVAKHRLTLAPTIEGMDLDISRWDSLGLHSITEPISEESGIPPLFAMFNVLKSEFLTARYLAYSAIHERVPESGKYFDTLDYADYGIKYSMLTLAQRTCIDILDKAAIATSEYLNLPGDPNRINFMNRWFDPKQKGKTLDWQLDIRKTIVQGNTALIAISDVACDIMQEGFLENKKTIRNSSTHRFTVLHELGDTGSRENKYIDHYGLDGFLSQLIETLQLTRSVLMYFGEMVALNEYLKSNDEAFRLPMYVPDHDWIRGEEP